MKKIRLIILSLLICFCLTGFVFSEGEMDIADGINKSFGPETGSLTMLIFVADNYENPEDNEIAAGVRADGRTMEQFGNILREKAIIDVKDIIVTSGRQVTKKKYVKYY